MAPLTPNTYWIECEWCERMLAMGGKVIGTCVANVMRGNAYAWVAGMGAM